MASWRSRHQRLRSSACTAQIQNAEQQHKTRKKNTTHTKQKRSRIIFPHWTMSQCGKIKSATPHNTVGACAICMRCCINKLVASNRGLSESGCIAVAPATTDSTPRGHGLVLALLHTDDIGGFCSGPKCYAPYRTQSAPPRTSADGGATTNG